MEKLHNVDFVNNLGFLIPCLRPGFVYTSILCVVHAFFTVPKQIDDLVYHDCPVKNVPLLILQCLKEIKFIQSCCFYILYILFCSQKLRHGLSLTIEQRMWKYHKWLTVKIQTGYFFHLSFVFSVHCKLCLKLDINS